MSLNELCREDLDVQARMRCRNTPWSSKESAKKLCIEDKWLGENETQKTPWITLRA